MTRDKSWISPARQRQWWAVRNARSTRAFLYRCGAHGVVAGYGLIRKSEGKTWLSGGLLPRHRGRGLGRALFAHLVARVRSACYLEVLKSNFRARRTYEALGFVVVDIRPKVLVMQLEQE